MLEDRKISDMGGYGWYHSLAVVTEADYSSWKAGLTFYDEQADTENEPQIKTPQQLLQKLDKHVVNENIAKKVGNRVIKELKSRLGNEVLKGVTVIEDKQIIKMLQQLGVFTYENYWKKINNHRDDYGFHDFCESYTLNVGGKEIFLRTFGYYEEG